jgi:exopolyphosphatase/guanosine-5'-triphosphate,3'-diphosphate pyrophosphatase
MKLAVIDCGTNTFNLIIVQVTGRNKYEKLFHTRIPVKLGEGTINGGYIDEKPFNRGLDAIWAFSKKIKQEKVEKVLAFATSAIRDGSNGMDFVRAVKENHGIDLNVIDGEREAELVYSAVKEAVTLNEEISMIMDIGGGSTEFLLANKDKIFWKHSFPIGVARLLDKFKPSDPITAAESEQIRQYLKEQLMPLTEAAKKFNPVELVGSSGAFESFVEMISSELGGEIFNDEKTSYTIDLGNYRRISDMVIASTLARRRKMKGLIPMRIDMIVICCIMVDFVIEQYQLKNMRMSTWSLKEGAMVDFVKQYV